MGKIILGSKEDEREKVKFRD
jgi:hypothetical protein